MDRIRVYVADDQPMFLEGLVAAIGERPELQLVGFGGDGRAALMRVLELAPDVLVLDMRLRGLNGEEALRLAAERGSSTRMLFLSAHIQSDLVYRALAGGAAGYVSKDVEREDMCDAIVAVARGEIVLSPDVQRSLAGAIRQRDVHDRAPLTPRERAVLSLAAEGCSTREIAARLHVTPATVKTHLQGVFNKLDVADRTSAVAAAIRRGLLD